MKRNSFQRFNFFVHAILDKTTGIPDLKVMFNARQLKEFLDAKPFRPFKIHMSDGSQYAVPHHDAAFLTQSKIEVGLDLNENGIARRSVHYSILHISQIEELQPA